MLGRDGSVDKSTYDLSHFFLESPGWPLPPLPALPPLDQAQIAKWYDAHQRFAVVEGEASPPVLAASRRLLRRLLIEGLANVQPVLADVDRPLLFPPPRRYLTLEFEQRLIVSSIEDARGLGHLSPRALSAANRLLRRHGEFVEVKCAAAGPSARRNQNG